MNSPNKTNNDSDEMIIESTEAFEQMLATKDLQKYVLRLYVAGNGNY